MKKNIKNRIAMQKPGNNNPCAGRKYQGFRSPGVFLTGIVIVSCAASSPTLAQETAAPATANPATVPSTTPPAAATPSPAATGQAATTPTGPTLTLKDLIQYALQYQPTLTEAQATQDASAQRVNEAKSTYYPNVTPSFTYTSNYTYAPTTVFTPTYDPVTGLQTGGSYTNVTQGAVANNRLGDIAATYQIYDNSRELTNRQARQNLRATIYNTQSTRQSIISNVAALYFQVLQDQALEKVAESQVTLTQNTLDVTQAQVNVGVAAKKDTLQAQANVLNAQVSQLQAQNNLQNAQAQLRNALGLSGVPQAETLFPGGNISLATLPEPTAATPLTVSVNSAQGSASTPSLSSNSDDAIRQLTSVALQTRPDIHAAQQNVESSETNVALQKVAAGVQLSAGVGAGLEFIPYVGNDRKINLAASYPLFDGGLLRSKVREAQAGVRSSQAQLESLKQTVSVETETAYRTLALARASLPAALAAQQAAQVNYDAANESRREGVESLVDVITAQNALVQAETNYVQAIYAFYNADAALAVAVGQYDRVGALSYTSTPSGTSTPAVPATQPVPATPPSPGG